jgi:lipoprotein NlpD
VALWLCFAVAGCASTGTPAPIVDRSQKKAPIVEAVLPASPSASTAPSQRQAPAAPADPRATAGTPVTTAQTDTAPPAAPPPRAAPAAAGAPPAPSQVTDAKTTSPPPAAAATAPASGAAGKTPAAAAPGSTQAESQQQVKSSAAQAAAARRAPAGSEEPAIRPYREGDWRPEFYVVKKGDTLYSIALDHGQDYRDLALWNNLADPSYIQVDQRLRLFPPGSSTEVSTPEPIALPPATLQAPRAAEAAAVPTLSEPKARRMQYSEQALAELTRYAAGSQRRATPTAAAGTAPAAATATPAAAPRPQPAPRSVQAGMSALPDERLVWEWPTDGRVIYGFGEGANHKGMGIDGVIGQAVVASAPGKVVYSGSGLRGYGKLIIIKHNATYLSVYAHNSQLLVREGQTVAQGQKIAEMGDSDSDRVALHFEIRRLGKPVDPLKHLPEKTS